MKRLKEGQVGSEEPVREVTFEITEAHRARPGWEWLWDRLLSPLPEEDGAVAGDEAAG